MTVQYIETNGQRQFAVLPIAEYEELIEIAEMKENVRTYDEAKASNEESIPGEMVERILNGENKVKVWREYRQLTQIALAERCGMDTAAIARIEAGTSNDMAMLRKIAETLVLDLDDLV